MGPWPPCPPWSQEAPPPDGDGEPIPGAFRCAGGVNQLLRAARLLTGFLRSIFCVEHLPRFPSTAWLPRHHSQHLTNRSRTGAACAYKQEWRCMESALAQQHAGGVPLPEPAPLQHAPLPVTCPGRHFFASTASACAVIEGNIPAACCSMSRRNLPPVLWRSRRRQRWPCRTACARSTGYK